MSMRKGSQENLHVDTGPLTLTEPMSLAASWLALEDIDDRSSHYTGRNLSWEAAAYGNDGRKPEPAAIDKMRELVPTSLRKKVPAPVRTFVRERLPR